MTSTASNRESPSCPDSTTSPSPLMTMASAAVTNRDHTNLSTPTTTAASLRSLQAHAGGPQVTTAHALALLPTLYSTYPSGSPPGIFSYIAAGLLPPPPTHPFHPLTSVTSEVARSTNASVKRPIAHLATSGLPPLI